MPVCRHAITGRNTGAEIPGKKSFRQQLTYDIFHDTD